MYRDCFGRLGRSLRHWISGGAWQGLAARCLTSATIVADGRLQPFAQLHAVFVFSLKQHTKFFN